MSEHIPRHRADVVPSEPLFGPAVNEYLRRLRYEPLLARYESVYNQFYQESQSSEGDVNQLQAAEIKRAYPGLYDLIERLASHEESIDFQNGFLLGAVSILSVIKSGTEIEEFNQLLQES